jgi:hypothetical protein
LCNVGWKFKHAFSGSRLIDRIGEHRYAVVGDGAGVKAGAPSAVGAAADDAGAAVRHSPGLGVVVQFAALGRMAW